MPDFEDELEQVEEMLSEYTMQFVTIGTALEEIEAMLKKAWEMGRAQGRLDSLYNGVKVDN